MIDAVSLTAIDLVLLGVALRYGVCVCAATLAAVSAAAGFAIGRASRRRCRET